MPAKQEVVLDAALYNGRLPSVVEAVFYVGDDDDLVGGGFERQVHADLLEYFAATFAEGGGGGGGGVGESAATHELEPPPLLRLRLKDWEEPFVEDYPLPLLPPATPPMGPDNH